MSHTPTLNKATLHPDAAYIVQDKIGPVIAKGLAVVYKEKPNNPVDFFAKWLLHQSQVKKREQFEDEKVNKIKDLKEKDAYSLREQQKILEEKNKLKKELDDRIDQFRARVEASDDLNDQLKDMADHLAEFTGATAAYVGKIVKPIKKIMPPEPEDVDEESHIIPTAKPHIQFLHASKDAKFMEDQILKQETGVTFDLFRDEVTHEKNPCIIDADNEKKNPKHIIIDEVVRNPNMHYFKVPRLGSYLAIKLEYNSCLFEEAFDLAVENYTSVNNMKKEQEKAKEQWEEDQARERKEKEENNEEYEEPEPPQWDEFSYASFKTQRVQFVVCLNTMGQDRKFSQDEINFALKCVKHYRDTWESREKANLEKDVLFKLEGQDYDRVYKEHFEIQDTTEIEKIVEDSIQNAQNEKTAQGEDDLTEPEKEVVAKKTRFEIMTKGFWAPEAAAEYRQQLEKQASAPGSHPEPENQRVNSAMSSGKDSNMDKKSAEGDVPPYTPLVPEMWKEKCQALGNLHVMKYRKVLQSLFYLLKFSDREVLCEKFTNRLAWKNIKGSFTSGDAESVYASMAQYQPTGSKEDEYKEYQKLRFIKDNLEGTSEEELDEFSVPFCKLYKWLMMAIDLRIDDVKTRRRVKQKEREMRDEACQREEERLERRQNELNEAKAAYEKQLEEEKADREDEELDDLDAQFNEEEFIDKFDEENPEFDIPPDVEDDVDNDYNIDSDEEPAE